MCGKLQYWLLHHTGGKKNILGDWSGWGLVPAAASPCCFYREADDVACVVHGDDFTLEGPADAPKDIAEEMRQFWIIKVRAVLGPLAFHDKGGIDPKPCRPMDGGLPSARGRS